MCEIILERKFQDDQEFEDFIEFLLKHFFRGRNSIIKEIIGDTLDSIDFIEKSDIRLDNAGIVSGGSSMSASYQFNPIIESGATSVAQIKDMGYWNDIVGWKHLFESFKDWIIRRDQNSKPYYRYKADIYIDDPDITKDLQKSFGPYKSSGIISKYLIRTAKFDGFDIYAGVIFRKSHIKNNYSFTIEVVDMDYKYIPGTLNID